MTDIEENNQLQIDLSRTKVDVSPDIFSICSNPNYLSHYIASHSDFLSPVIVILWKSSLPGPSLIHNGYPLLYVQHVTCHSEEFNEWIKSDDISKNEQAHFNSDQIQTAAQIYDVIERNYDRLFRCHSNLVAIRLKLKEQFFIEFVVLCKHFLPVIDKEALPRSIENIPTIVCSGWSELCGRQEQKYHRPLLPGAGFAVAEDSKLDLEVPFDEYNPPVLATIGGWFISGENTYGVTCAHCIKKNQLPIKLHLEGSDCFQPCAIGLILNESVLQPGLIETYDSLKENYGRQYAMKWLIEQLQENNPEFCGIPPIDSICGTVHGGILGPLNDGGPTVDVGLVKLNGVPIDTYCTPSKKFPGLFSPDLCLKEDTEILKLDNFPYESFSVYGRGARSIDTMKATVNSLEKIIYFRELTLGGLVFKCIHAETTMNWKPGDSGTWCWTSDGKLVGMGMAHVEIQGRNFCCMMPMSDVEAAIRQLVC
jgi:hypothetical protein